MITRRLPLVLFVIVLAILPLQAWARAAERTSVVNRPNKELTTIEWTGSIQPDGTLAARVDFHFTDKAFKDDTNPKARQELPARAVHATAYGKPVRVSSSQELQDVVVHPGVMTITYQVPNAVRRQKDGVVLDTALHSSLIGMVDFDDVEMRGVLYWPGGSKVGDPGKQVRAQGVSSMIAESEPGQLRFTSVNDPWNAVRLAALLPADAAPQSQAKAGSAAVDFETIRHEIDTGKLSHSSPSVPGKARKVVTALLLSAELAVLVLYGLYRLGLAARRYRTAVDGTDAEEREPPDDLAPGVVAVLVGERGRGFRSAVAGTLLQLADHKVVEVDGIDSEKFKLTIPAGAKGSTRAEDLVLTQLRPQGKTDVDAELLGPPLWGTGPQPWLGEFSKELVGQAKSHNLTSYTVKPWVVVPIGVVMGVTSVVNSAGQDWLGWVVIFASPILGTIASVLAGNGLTAAGARARRRWLSFGKFLGEDEQLKESGVPAVSVWGPNLAYGAVLGACPKAAEALSPDRQ